MGTGIITALIEDALDAGAKMPINAQVASALKAATGIGSKRLSVALGWSDSILRKTIARGATAIDLSALGEMSVSDYTEGLIEVISKRLGVEPAEEPQPEDPVEVERQRLAQRREQTEEKRAIREAVQEAERMDLLKALAGEYKRNGVPAWVSLSKSKPKMSQDSGLSTAVVVLSDTHFDEVVNAAEVDYVNEYNRGIAESRLAQFFQNTIALAKEHTAGITYEGIVCCLAGDMISGDIHEELATTNEATSVQTVLHWSGLVADGLRLLADAFGRVYVPCVVGNHGRTTRKPRAKQRVHTSLDWMLYQIVARELSSDDRITMDISEAADLLFDVHGTRFLLTHGDQFKGGSGIAGALSPLMIGDSRKRKRGITTGRPYDYMIVGHWHQYGMFKSIIMNGSLKGYDEYAYVSNFDVEPPQQAWFVVDSRHGITLRAPVLVNIGERYTV